MASLAEACGLNIDYFPTNFVVRDQQLFYIDYECNPYMDQWNFENWGILYWTHTPELEAYLASLAKTAGGKEKMELTIASNNAGKIREFRDILTPLGFRVISQRERGIDLEPEETGTDFAENAILKAQAIHAVTHGCVISDDSGLEVEALNGEPGIYSARYKGLPSEHERRLAILDGLKDCENRKARFVCCVCFTDETGENHLFTGIWNGTIAEKEEGTSGFGYDPIFISEDSDGKTTASLPVSFKETYSHRAKALKQLLDYLQSRTQ
jgi:XTP/dITP diphosphohydrolase